ncbi:MAG: VCBS repeat-containing protein [Acidobacteriota bacterium]
MYYNAKFVREQLLGVKRKELACRGETNKEYESNPMSGASGAYQHSPRTIRTLAGVLGGALLALVLLRAEAPPQSFPVREQEQSIDRTRLEVVEELSESLANDMLDLSLALRNREEQKISEFVPVQLFAVPLPSNPLPMESEVKWISKHGWTSEAPGAGARAMSSQEFLRGWSSFLGHFSEIEDMRFKVKEAWFDDSATILPDAQEPTATVGSQGRARLAFFLVGRDQEDRREWARGQFQVSVRRAENGRWQFESFAVTSLESMVALRDLFSEVAVPAGVSTHRPAYGTVGNRGFVWHGAAAGDFNRDGWLDLFATGPDRYYLYLNDGAGRFREAGSEVGLQWLDTGVAPIALDYDNDGDLDVFISAVGPQILLENRLVPEGKLRFLDVSLKAGVAVQAMGFSAVAGDVNGDGYPDIYVASYNHYGRVKPNSWFRATNGTPNLLFVNLGSGRFREEAVKWRVDDRRWSYAAQFADVDGDGRLDLYIANDFGENSLFLNRGDHFVDRAQARGVLDPGYGMGVSFGDYNNDGLLDLHVTNMSSTAGNRILSRLYPDSSPQNNVLRKLAAGNNLYKNIGGGRYQDVTAEVGGFQGGWAWGGGFLDVDNDGWEDIFTPNGFVSGKSMKDT